MSALASIRRTILRRQGRQLRVIGQRVVHFGFEKALIPDTRQLRGWAIRRIYAPRKEAGTTNWRMRVRWILDGDEAKPGTKPGPRWDDRNRRRNAAKRGGAR